MLVICEDCAKKYNIDESRIKGRRARFTCNECGHIIIIDKADIARPLVHKSEEEHGAPPTIDLLREMEAPFETDESGPLNQAEGETASDQTDEGKDTPVTPVQKKTRGTSIIAFFSLAALLSFIIISAGLFYVYTSTLAPYLQQQVSLRAELIMQAVMVLGAAWLLVFLLLICMARHVSRSIIRITEDANRIALGERDRQITPRGPDEIKELASVIQKLIPRQ